MFILSPTRDVTLTSPPQHNPREAMDPTERPHISNPKPLKPQPGYETTHRRRTASLTTAQLSKPLPKTPIGSPEVAINKLGAHTGAISGPGTTVGNTRDAGSPRVRSISTPTRAAAHLPSEGTSVPSTAIAPRKTRISHRKKVPSDGQHEANVSLSTSVPKEQSRTRVSTDERDRRRDGTRISSSRREPATSATRRGPSIRDPSASRRDPSTSHSRKDSLNNPETSRQGSLKPPLPLPIPAAVTPLTEGSIIYPTTESTTPPASNSAFATSPTNNPPRTTKSSAASNVPLTEAIPTSLPTTRRAKHSSSLRFIPPDNMLHDRTPSEPPPTGDTKRSLSLSHSHSHSRGHTRTYSEAPSHISHADSEKPLLEDLALPPGYGEKKALTPEKEEFQRSMRRRRIKILIIAGLIIALLITAIALLVKFVRPKVIKTRDDLLQSDGSDQSNGSSNNDQGNDGGVIAGFTQAQSDCLTNFRTSAPLNTRTYDCQTCLSEFSDIDPNVLSGEGREQESADVKSGIQFCVLKSFFEASSLEGRAGLWRMGWMRTVEVCRWGGVGCDTSNSTVISLALTPPGTPLTLPSLASLTSLQTLDITGSGTAPAGQLTPSLLPSNLATLQLIRTGLQPFPDGIFNSGSALSRLTTLVIDNNPSMGTTIPNSVLELPLKTLFVRAQNLTSGLDAVFASEAFGNSLTTLDLAYNLLPGRVPTPFLARLENLNLSNNNLTTIFADVTFPDTLQTVSFENNPILNGNLPPSLCGNENIRDCSFVGTGFSSITNLTCGDCRFA